MVLQVRTSAHLGALPRPKAGYFLFLGGAERTAAASHTHGQASYLHTINIKIPHFTAHLDENVNHG